MGAWARGSTEWISGCLISVHRVRLDRVCLQEWDTQCREQPKKSTDVDKSDRISNDDDSSSSSCERNVSSPRTSSRSNPEVRVMMCSKNKPWVEKKPPNSRRSRMSSRSIPESLHALLVVQIEQITVLGAIQRNQCVVGEARLSSGGRLVVGQTGWTAQFSEQSRGTGVVMGGETK
jgi:hypothetical protein